MEVPTVLEPEYLAGSGAFERADWPMGVPQESFEPFFASLAAMNPRANFEKTDVIAHTSTLHLMMGVARGTFAQFGKSNLPFAFHASMVNGTLLIKKLGQFDRPEGLGRGASPTVNSSFLNKITEMKPGVEDASSEHYQALRYDIGPMRCVAIVPVEAAIGNDTLPPLTFDDKLIPGTPGSVNVRNGGGGVLPTAVAKIYTAGQETAGQQSRVSNGGHLKLKHRRMATMWLTRPNNILEGHLKAEYQGIRADVPRKLLRVTIRSVKHTLAHIEDVWQLDFRRLVTVLDVLRNVAQDAGGSCILTYHPPVREPFHKPSKFELHKCSAEAPPLVLDWHVKQFWRSQK